MNSYKLSDEVISQIAKLIQLAILTGTDVIDNLRTVRVQQSELEDGALTLTPEYREMSEKQVEKLLAEVAELSNTQLDSWESDVTNNRDCLSEMFELRERFMVDLIKKYPTVNPEWPLDLSEKAHQQYCRDIALRGVEEMFEALQHLKNWKPHRTTEIKEFDKNKFLEEIVDAFNYFFSLIILTGHSSDDLYDAYLKKDKIIHERLNNDY